MLGGITGKESGNHSCSHDQKGVVVVDALGLFVKPALCFVFLKVVILHSAQTENAIQGTPAWHCENNCLNEMVYFFTIRFVVVPDGVVMRTMYVP